MENELTIRPIDLGHSVVLPTLEMLRKYVKYERDFNATWILLHLRDGHPQAAERRREIVAERDSWLGALDQVIRALKIASSEPSL
jgi:hypothetical protein